MRSNLLRAKLTTWRTPKLVRLAASFYPLHARVACPCPKNRAQCVTWRVVYPRSNCVLPRDSAPNALRGPLARPVRPLPCAAVAFDEANDAFRSGDFQRAYDLWTASVESVVPEQHHVLHTNRGAALERLGRLEDSIEVRAQAGEAQPKLCMVCVVRGARRACACTGQSS
ncbi:hypothetical protein EON67_10340 [archaeon]|nr:MAG: hypothetical protein EON67_10340 [archaeon]